MSNNNTNTQGTTFWKFLTDNTIEIPIIQRDYAQGRLGKEYLRKIFLADIKNALENKGKMKLDFVYGSVENEIMSPLDGQQRLTTLWLLHWYIALMSDNLNEEVCKTLAKFTYETRISSREFCQNLCKPENFTAYKDFKPTEKRRIVDYITSRTWFYSAWKQDPTIQSMLRMLGGTEINDKKGKDIIDGVEELLNCLESCVFKPDEKCKLKRNVQYYWDLLVSEEAPIVFYQLSLEHFGLSDDLYIKMNARGKQLTSFENFKADLIGYIRDNNWTDLLDAKNGIPIKMDTTWTDIFWKNKSKDNRIDEIFYAFINRSFLNELICLKDKDKYSYTADNLEKDPVFTYLYGNKGDDAIIKYVGLDKYGIIPKSFFDNLNKALDGYKNVGDIKPKWEEDQKNQIYLIPKYNEEGEITTLGQKERIIFLAVSRYLQSGEYEKETFEKWMRVVWNIVENSGIDTIPAMISVMWLIDEISTHSHDIYNFLANDENVIRSNAAQKQVAEERAKAKQILLNEKTSNEGFAVEDIISAESHPLLKGSISALFEDDNCEIVSFGQNIHTRIKLLDELWKKDDDKDYTLVKVLISLYDKEKPENKLYLKRNKENWKILVTDKLKDSFRKINNRVEIGECTGWKSMLAYTNLIEMCRDSGKIVSTYWDGKIVLWGTSGCNWNAYGNVILDEMHRDKSLLDAISNSIVECSQKIENCDFFWGWNINFKYPKDGNSYDFQWNADGNIYLVENNERKKKTDGTVYCFPTKDINNSDSFKDELDKLISEIPS